MKFEIVELDEFSGRKAGIYSVWIEDEEMTLFDKFVEENQQASDTELGSITDRLEIIGHITGAREQYFKINEGTLGDGLCALYDSPDRKLRLYCIRYGSTCIVLGGGGEKNVRALQDDEKLKSENYLLRYISKRITDALKDGEIWWSVDGRKLEGDLYFEIL
jgi:hypothetical protein